MPRLSPQLWILPICSSYRIRFRLEASGHLSPFQNLRRIAFDGKKSPADESSYDSSAAAHLFPRTSEQVVELAMQNERLVPSESTGCKRYMKKEEPSSLRLDFDFCGRTKEYGKTILVVVPYDCLVQIDKTSVADAILDFLRHHSFVLGFCAVSCDCDSDCESLCEIEKWFACPSSGAHDDLRDQREVVTIVQQKTAPSFGQNYIIIMMNQPNQTLYIKNIDWKIKKPLLKRALYSLFTRHGKVLEVIVLRREGLRGQAWVVFEDIQAATAALQAESGFSFFGKDLILEYAREKSDRIAKREGTYVPKAKRQKKSQDRQSVKEEKNESKEEPDEAEAGKKSEVPSAPPSKYLLAQNLPSEINEMILSMLFRQYAGYKEVRMPRPGLAFIEFEDEAHATLALGALNGFKLTEKDTLELIYGKQ